MKLRRWAFESRACGLSMCDQALSSIRAIQRNAAGALTACSLLAALSSCGFHAATLGDPSPGSRADPRGAFAPASGSEVQVASAARWLETARSRGFVEWEGPTRRGLALRAWLRPPPAPSELTGLVPEPPEAMAGRTTPRHGQWLIVFESDGAPWRGGGRIPPSDPTPQQPAGLRIALSTRHEGPILYLGRPCQFQPGSTREKRFAALDSTGAAHAPAWREGCRNATLWTTHRYSSEVVEGYRRLLEDLAHDGSFGSGAPRIFAGFSGGGTLAALVAAAVAKTDQGAGDCLITLASPLDLEAWTRSAQLSSLAGSLNPADQPVHLGPLRGSFLFGEKDRRIGPETFGRLANHAQIAKRLRIIPNLSHSVDWSDALDDSIDRFCQDQP